LRCGTRKKFGTH